MWIRRSILCQKRIKKREKLLASLERESRSRKGKDGRKHVRSYGEKILETVQALHIYISTDTYVYMPVIKFEMTLPNHMVYGWIWYAPWGDKVSPTRSKDRYQPSACCPMSVAFKQGNCKSNSTIATASCNGMSKQVLASLYLACVAFNRHGWSFWGLHITARQAKTGRAKNPWSKGVSSAG